MKLGIFGGSFNPPHLGHLIVAESVHDQLAFDKVLFIPSALPPHKLGGQLAPPAMRLEMTGLAIAENLCFEASDVELRREGPSYTIDTLLAIASSYPHAELSLIIGVDNFLDFGSWKSPDAILERARLVVMNRPGFPPPRIPAGMEQSIHIVDVPSIGISGTDIRHRVRENRSIRYLVPPAVEQYIARHHLYRA